jgi:hypothetical protein
MKSRRLASGEPPGNGSVRIAATKPGIGQSDEWFTTWSLLALFLAGVLVSLFILLFNFPSWSHYRHHFAGNGAFLLWAGLVCTRTGVWVVALAWLLPSLRRHWSARSFFSPELLLSTLMVAIPTAVIAVVSATMKHWPDYIPGALWKLITLTAPGYVVGLVLAWGIWLVRDGLRQIGQQPLSTESEKATALKTFLICKDDLNRFLGTLGAILGLLVLSTAAHRQMVLSYATYSAYHKQPDEKGVRIPEHFDYGFQLMLVFGLLFTLLIAAIYLPTHLTRTRVADHIREAYFPAVSPDSPEWSSRKAQRDQLGGVLGLADGPLSQFKTAVPILSPLIGALLGLLLK